MIIKYANKKIEKVCLDLDYAKRKYPEKIAKELHKAKNFIISSETLLDVMNYKPYNFHDLKGDRKGQYAIDIGGRKGGYRLICSFQEEKEIVFAELIKITEIILKEMGNHYE